MPAPTFGMQTIANRPWPELVELWRRIERFGFDHLWVADHFVPTFRPELPLMEMWMVLSGMATVTERIRIGALVACNTFRHPSLLAKEAVTVDHISGGRFELGIGAGWIEFEHVMFGLPYPDDATRVAMYAESVQLVDLLLSQDVTTFAGRYYQVTDAPFRPGPVQRPRPPLTLAAHRPRMLKVIAPYVDRWNSMGSPAEMRERGARLDEAVAAAGRDPRGVIKSLLYVPSILPDERPWDSPEAFLDFAGRFGEAGVHELILQPPRDGSWGVIERVALDVLPNLRSAGSLCGSAPAS